MKALLPWATAACTLLGVVLVGNRRWQGWCVWLGCRVLWVALIVAYRAWGLLPLTASLVVVYSRNLRRWRREERAA